MCLHKLIRTIEKSCLNITAKINQILILEMNLYEDSYQLLIEKLSYKIGGFAIYLGIMLFFNLFFFFRGKRKAKEGHLNTQNPVIN